MIWRIRTRREFEQLARDGRRIRPEPDPADPEPSSPRSLLWCTYLPDPNARPPRVAFAIGRAVGPAVVRNRLRRRIRSVLADHEATLPSGWYLFGTRATSERTNELTFDRIRTEIDQLIRGVRRPGRVTSS